MWGHIHVYQELKIKDFFTEIVMFLLILENEQGSLDGQGVAF